MTKRIPAQAVIVGTSFSLLLAGSNAASPLLPVYREVLGFDPLLLSFTFVFYVVVLTVVLFAAARPRIVRYAPTLLVSALSVALLADLLLATGTPAGVLLGRAATGIGVGIGTGAAAALMVASLGDAGRSLVATGNLIGAVLGTAASQLWVFFVANEAVHWVFLSHAALCAIVAVALGMVLARERGANRMALAPVAADPGSRPTGRRFRDEPVPYAIGIVAWLAVSMTIVYAPSLFVDLNQPLVGATGNLLVLAASAAGQLASPALTRVAPWLSGLVSITVGASAIVVGAHLEQGWIAIVGFGVLGFGVGLSYRLCLVYLTRGLTPLEQGATSSFYSSLTYGVAAVAVLGLGALGSAADLLTAATLGYTALAACALALALLRSSPRLRNLQQNPAPLTLKEHHG